jgi:phosphogluconate dehydratase
LPAIARAAGIVIDWQDFADLSSAVPLIARVYPNGAKDVNDFHDAGGMAFVTYTLSHEGLIHTDHLTAGADSMDAWIGSPELHGDELVWKPAEESADIDMLRPATDPFQADGGLRLVQGNLGRAVFKTSAVDEERWLIEAPARCFSDQNEVLEAFKAGELDGDCAVIVRFQGPRANGMPELHKLTPTLGVLQDRGHRVALITDGRMSGASGKVPAAKAWATAAWLSNTRAGASTVQRSRSTALVLNTARPRLPSSRRIPPSAWNGSAAPRRIVSSPEGPGSRQASSSPSSHGSRA